MVIVSAGSSTSSAAPPPPGYPSSQVIQRTYNPKLRTSIPLRRGFYDATSDKGFGWDKIWNKHKIDNLRAMPIDGRTGRARRIVTPGNPASAFATIAAMSSSETGTPPTVPYSSLIVPSSNETPEFCLPYCVWCALPPDRPSWIGKMRHEAKSDNSGASQGDSSVGAKRQLSQAAR